MDGIPEKDKEIDSDENPDNIKLIDKLDAALTSAEKAEIDRLKGISLHQRMLSRMVKVGYEGLTDEERAYWNSVY